jgi:PUA domain protein
MEEVEAGTLIAIHAEGKTHAIAVGATTMSTKEIRETNKDIGVNNLQYVGDDLWKLDIS